MRFKDELIGLGGCVLLVGGVVGGVMVYHSAAYVETRAVIVAVEDGCILRRDERQVSGGITHRRTDSTDFMPCESARDLRRTRHRGYDLRGRQRLTVDYDWPVDGTRRRASLTTEPGFHPGAAPGMTIRVRAHRSDPQTILSDEAL